MQYVQPMKPVTLEKNPDAAWKSGSGFLTFHRKCMQKDVKSGETGR